MRRFLSILAALALLALSAPPSSALISPYFGDACQGSYQKQTAAFNISSATTTSVVAPVTGQAIYVCAVDINQAGGTGTVVFEYGTGATCGTGTTTLTGPFTANTTAGTTTNIVIGGNSTVMLAPVTQRLCILSTGTIVQAGFVTYVQR